ncbi:MAG: acetylxylan esterase [Verrucomicrobiaceae bacterium]|nr:acetylxylan esterase [Verrucomicrobiaceae bacterium]
MKFTPLAAVITLSAFSPSLSAEQVGPWNLDALKSNVPAMKWLRQDQPIHSLTYAGEKYQGHDTEVFAFYASPTTLGEAKAGTKFPAVVCIHGGGGTAFAEWVQLWAKRGYAAIAMDLNGSRPPEVEFDAKGIAIGNGDTSDDWPFHAAASVIRAHTLLRSFPEVDAEHTAVTGISWGGYTTCLVASLDDRFKAAVPVYGCGFLHEGESVQKPSIDKLGEHKAKWVKEYDPGSLLPRCRVPIMFVNGTNDVHYVLDSYMKSYNVVPGEKHMRIQVKMPHGHPPGWAPQEIGLFIDSKCRDGKPLPILGRPRIDGDTVRVIVNSRPPIKLKSAALHYSKDDGLRSKREWVTVPASIFDINASINDAIIKVYEITAPKPPAEANTWYLSVTDERDAMVSTKVVLKP